MASVEPRSYVFGPPEDGTLVAGLHAGQLAVVGSTLVLCVLVLRAIGGNTAIPLMLVLLAIGAALTFWPLGGRTMVDWLPVLLRWAQRVIRGDIRYRSSLPLLGVDDDAPEPPPTLRGVRIITAPVVTGGEVGVIRDERAMTYSAVLIVRGQPIQLVDQTEKERRLAAWGAVLAGLARVGSLVHRVQWVDRTVPDDGDAMGQYLARAGKVPIGSPSLASYLELVDAAGSITQQHEAFVVVSISARRAARAIRQAGGKDEGAVTVLLREVTMLSERLAAADIGVEGVCTPRLLAGVLRVGFEPNARSGLARRAAAAQEERGTSPPNAWPLASETAWSAYQVADMWHATYWIAHWPRSPVGPDFLSILLLGTQALRAISLTLEPVDPTRAYREVEQAMAKGAADDHLRSEGGFLPTTRRQRERDAVARREAELADGHRDYRFSGFVTVSAPTREQLEEACGEVEQQAQQAAMELRRMYGEQDVAFTCTLPLGRGLR